MRVVDLIDKKKRGNTHSKDEIDYIIKSMMEGETPDYQVSAWLMAVYFNGMTLDETVFLTDALVKSGTTINFGELASNIIDKHSTGGVGDKVTLTLTPLLAACNVPIAKLSGRGLGHTGGTIDKLESIPGFKTDLTIEDFILQIHKIGVAIASQTQNLTPADGKLYALRDVTATVDSKPLIASSVVSKKIASGADNIVLDVKYGSGAFIKTAEEAVELSELMVEVGKRLSKNITAVVTAMDEPLGRAVGNAIEVIESIEFLKGNTSGDLTDLTYEFGALSLVQLRKFENTEAAKDHLKSIVESGAAVKKFEELVNAQNGNIRILEDYTKFEQPKFKVQVKSNQSGFINKIDAYKIAYGCKLLGAGRERKIDDVDHSVGVYLNKKVGEYCNEGEVIYTIYSNDENRTIMAEDTCSQAFEFSSEHPHKNDLIYKIIK
jgi:pyrimidine-nucleoside phosphorylase